MVIITSLFSQRSHCSDFTLNLINYELNLFSSIHCTGIIYDVIVEPPSVGSMTDEHGHQRPVAFLAYRCV